MTGSENLVGHQDDNYRLMNLLNIGQREKTSKEHLYKTIYKIYNFLRNKNHKQKCLIIKILGGAVASWLVRPSPDRAVRVRALAGDTVLCSSARRF